MFNKKLLNKILTKEYNSDSFMFIAFSEVLFAQAAVMLMFILSSMIFYRLIAKVYNNFVTTINNFIAQKTKLTYKLKLLPERSDIYLVWRPFNWVQKTPKFRVMQRFGFIWVNEKFATDFFNKTNKKYNIVTKINNYLIFFFFMLSTVLFFSIFEYFIGIRHYLYYKHNPNFYRLYISNENNCNFKSVIIFVVTCFIIHPALTFFSILYLMFLGTVSVLISEKLKDRENKPSNLIYILLFLQLLSISINFLFWLWIMFI